MDRDVMLQFQSSDQTDILITSETWFRILEAKVQNKDRLAPEVVVIEEAGIILIKNHTYSLNSIDS